MPPPLPAVLPPLVLVHGLWDTPRLFDPLVARLRGRREPLVIPHLPHGLGEPPLLQLAERLGRHLEEQLGAEGPLDVLGFSMGAVVARTWIQLLGGHRRTRRFISVAGPHRGTLTAQPIPRAWLPGLADMKIGSPLLRRLNGDLTPLRKIDCRSFFTRADLMVVPGWRAVLPVGPATAVPVWSHPALLSDPRALETLCAALLAPEL
jgi:triacylglycerol lipase